MSLIIRALIIRLLVSFFALGIKLSSSFVQALILACGLAQELIYVLRYSQLFLSVLALKCSVHNWHMERELSFFTSQIFRVLLVLATLLNRPQEPISRHHWRLRNTLGERSQGSLNTLAFRPMYSCIQAHPIAVSIGPTLTCPTL